MSEAERIWYEAKALQDAHKFVDLALRLFRYQAHAVPAYASFVRLCDTDVDGVDDISRIPFMPVEFFKNFKIHDELHDPVLCFSSSRTTGSVASRHYVVDPDIYQFSFMKGFQMFYGDPTGYRILALLPGYLERGDSSLVHMVNGLVEASNNHHGGFYLDNFDLLESNLKLLQNSGSKSMLIGVSFALLDFFESRSLFLPDLIVMETGGMKGKRRELVRAELHERIKKASGVPVVHSEYGMTELLSQAYSVSDGLFTCPPWMKVLIRESDDPFGNFVLGRTGLVNVIDLANVHSCAFLATKDLGKKTPDGRFEILGRSDDSEIRGCNLMF